MYGNSWLPVISEVLVCGLLNIILLLLEHGPTKIVRLNPQRKVRQLKCTFRAECAPFSQTRSHMHVCIICTWAVANSSAVRNVLCRLICI